VTIVVARIEHPSLPQKVGSCGLLVFLHVLVVLVGHRAGFARGGIGLGEGVVFLIQNGAVEPLLEDRLGFVELKLGLEVGKMDWETTAIRTATGIDKVEVLIDYLLADAAPIASTGTVLLRLLGVNTLEAVLGEELG
jgi:hypothetical protein